MRSEEAKKQAVELIRVAVLKCSSSLGIDMSPDQIKVLTEDIMEVYPVESVEDITYCLRQGRQGAYNDIPTYGKFNMLIFKQWMARHLDRKYEAKEKQLQAEKKEKDDEEFDRQKFYEAGIAYQEDLKAINDAEEKKKAEYIRLRTEIAKRYVAEEKKNAAHHPSHEG